MDKKKRFMEAVAEKVSKRQPVLKRKPGMAVMIAIGAPKPPMKDDDADGSMAEAEDSKTSKAQKIAALQEKIAALKAELALLEDEDEMDDEMDESEDESEDEDED